MKITDGDRKFIEGTLMPRFRVKRLGIKYNPSTRKWPDIWVQDGGVPMITVTETWRRKPMRQRHIELVHEFLHLTGLEHGQIGRLSYNTRPELDTYSKEVYRRLI